MPELETPAVTVTQDSAPAALPEIASLSPAERQTWRETGELPKKQDSAPAKKEAVADSAPQNDRKEAAPDSAPEMQKPHLKTKEDTEKRIKELLDDRDGLRKRLETLERERTQPQRDARQESQPAAEVYKPLDEKEFFKQNPKATYEDFVRAAGKHEGIWAARQEIAADNERRAQAEAQKELASKVADVKTRYPDAEPRIRPALDQIMSDKQIPFPVKATINDSPVLMDLLYVISEPAALQDLIQTAKTNPTSALRKIFITEQLVQAELAKSKGAKDSGKGADTVTESRRDESGKFVSSKSEEKAHAEPITKAPRPPVEVGGRQSAPEDGETAAVKSRDFRSFKAAADRAYAAKNKL